MNQVATKANRPTSGGHRVTVNGQGGDDPVVVEHGNDIDARNGQRSR